MNRRGFLAKLVGVVVAAALQLECTKPEVFYTITTEVGALSSQWFIWYIQMEINKATGLPPNYFQ